MSYSRGWTLEQVEDLKYMYEKGYSQKEVSEAIGKSISAIIVKAKELNIVYRRSHRYRESDNTYFCITCREFKEKWQFYFNKETGRVFSECIDCRSERKRKARIEKKIQGAGTIKSKEEVNGGPLKVCIRCKKEFPVELFTWEYTGRKIKAYCPSCNSNKQKQQRLKMIEKRGY